MERSLNKLPLRISKSAFDEIADLIRVYGFADAISEEHGETVIDATSMMLVLDTHDILEKIEDGIATVDELVFAIKMARKMSDVELKAAEVFGPTEGEVVPLILHRRDGLSPDECKGMVRAAFTAASSRFDGVKKGSVN